MRGPCSGESEHYICRIAEPAPCQENKIRSTIKAAAIGFVCLPLAFAPPALAQKRGGGGNQQPRSDFGQALPSAGLSVHFPNGAACTPISSPYGSPTRYDGSKRPTGGLDGVLHGGIDLTLKPETPLLAVAPGRVFSIGEGGMLEGNFIWILHLPADTGLPFGFLAKYQHLLEKPNVARGERVSVGQAIALSGKTGTVGGHYRSAGYPHLHLTVRMIPDDKLPLVENAAGEFLINRDTVIIDPLSIYIPGIKAPGDDDALSNEARQLSIAYVDGAGSVQPPSAGFVWPVACP